MSNPNPIRWVRKHVFRATQEELATIGGVSRPRISRYETSEDPPYDFLRKLRDEALRRGLPFSADWFFQPPTPQPTSDYRGDAS